MKEGDEGLLLFLLFCNLLLNRFLIRVTSKSYSIALDFHHRSVDFMDQIGKIKSIFFDLGL